MSWLSPDKQKVVNMNKQLINFESLFNEHFEKMSRGTMPLLKT